jgi:signal transduction histidine kinase
MTGDEPLICNVDDNPASRYVITRMLRQVGFRVVEVASGEQALALAARERPNLMILELKLPDIDGMEVCRRLKADPRTASIAILQTSAEAATPEAKVHGLEGGADGFLSRPFSALELVATVRSLLRLMERELAQSRRADALAEADRRKDEFLAMLAHELRNPMAAITTAHAILERHPARDPAERRAREIASRQTAQLGRLVDDLLDVSRVMRGTITLHREAVDFTELVLQATELAREVKLRTTERRLSFVAPGPLSVDGDRARLLQVISNLLDNAIKYTRHGGAIDVSLTEEAGEVVMRVRDDGVGIEADALESVFELFFQAPTAIDRSRGGLGIGLTLVRTLMQLHGGTVRARSEGEGRGTEVELRLPASRGRAATAAKGRTPAPERRRVRVLIVEDNVDAREILAELCGLWEHEVIVAEDGLTAVEVALTHRPDIAFVDIGLPGIDGYEVARRVRADPRGAAIKLVALSGYGAAEHREAAAAAGFSVHLIKPADSEQLAELIAGAGRS